MYAIYNRVYRLTRPDYDCSLSHPVSILNRNPNPIQSNPNGVRVRAADVWSAGCVLAELLLGQPLFPGESGVDQLVEIIKILGTPTREQIREMNPNYTEFKFPQIKPHPWQKVFRPKTNADAIDLVTRLLEYTPSTRFTPIQACAHRFFDELRDASARLPNGRELPALFNFTQQGAPARPNSTEPLALHPRPQRAHHIYRFFCTCIQVQFSSFSGFTFE